MLLAGSAKPTCRAASRILPHRRHFSTEQWSRVQAQSEKITQDLEASGETVGVAELASGGLISAMLWTSPAARLTFKGAGVRLAYGINREADTFGRNRARDFAKEKMSAGFAADFGESRLGKRESARWGLIYEDGESTCSCCASIAAPILT